MKFRKFLLSCRLFWRYRVADKKRIKLERQLSLTVTQNAQETTELRQFYEHKLARERLKFEAMNNMWVDRFLMLQKLLSGSHVTQNLDEKAAEEINTAPYVEPDPETYLTGDIKAYYDDSKEQFIEFEIETNGRSRAEAERIWTDGGFKDAEILRARNMF